MIIGIDIRVLGNPVKSGIEEYTENLLSHMLLLDEKIEFKLFYSSLRCPLPGYEWLHFPNVRVYRFRYPNSFLFGASRIFNRPFADRLIGGCDVFFSPHFFLSPLSPYCRRITTFHDFA